MAVDYVTSASWVARRRQVHGSSAQVTGLGGDPRTACVLVGLLLPLNGNVSESLEALGNNPAFLWSPCWMNNCLRHS